LLDLARRLLIDVLNAIGLESVDIVANSLGALWSAALAQKKPAEFRASSLPGRRWASSAPGVPIQFRLVGQPFVGQALGRRLMSNPTRDGSRTFWGEILVTHPERLDKALLDADIASGRRNLDSHLSLLSRIGVGGLPRELMLGEGWTQLAVQTTLVWGDRDALLSPAAPVPLAEAYPLTWLLTAS
jgi:pimeloyl-ACP methyl ester carboxylesterase